MTGTMETVEIQSAPQPEKIPATAETTYESDDFETADELSLASDDEDEQQEQRVTTATPLATTANARKTICNLEPEASAALLEWRRRSLIVRATGDPRSKKRKSELWRSSEAFVGNFRNLLKISNAEEDEEHQIVDANDIVEKLWKRDKDTNMPYKSLVSFLGSSNRFNRSVLHLYFEKFDFTETRLDDAFREVCQRLDFTKAETEEINRILDAFARRYWACNLHEVYGSLEVVRTTIDALALLSIELLVATRHCSVPKFCRDTMRSIRKYEGSCRTTILAMGGLEQWRQNMKSLLEGLYLSVERSNLFAAESTGSVLIFETNFSGKDRRDSRIVSRGDDAIYECGVTGGGGATKTSVDRRITTTRRSSSASTWTRLRRKDIEREKVGPSKEGPGACKYPFYSPGNDHTWTWKPCWMILNRGSLFIYVHVLQSGKAAGANSGEGSYSQSVELHRSPYQAQQVYLGHALAIPSAELNGQAKTSTFTLKLSGGKSFEFDCGSEDQMLAWISHCTYWAALESRVPTHPTLLENVDEGASWHPSPAPAGASILGPPEQLAAIRNHLAWLSEQKTRLAADTSTPHAKEKRRYIESEIKKYTYYNDTLNSSLYR